MTFLGISQIVDISTFSVQKKLWLADESSRNVFWEESAVHGRVRRDFQDEKGVTWSHNSSLLQAQLEFRVLEDRVPPDCSLLDESQRAPRFTERSSACKEVRPSL